MRAIVDAEHRAGLKPELLTYGHGAHELTVEWPHHRIPNVTRDRSLRSGPSWRKVVQDAQLAGAARRLHTALSPSRTVAHHVEAAAAALVARVAPLTFFAHTALGPELPTYLPPPRADAGRASLAPRAARTVAERAGDALDVALAKRADAVAAVSPWLAERLEARAGRPVRYVSVPWTVPPPIAPEERVQARRRFRFGPLAPVFLYAGNLDAYQGVDRLAEPFAIIRRRRPDAQLLVATASDPTPLARSLRSAGLSSQVRFAPLASEADRRQAHAAADAVWVPRAAPGGLPMKLLDALARGVPTIVTRRATAGLELTGAAMVAADDDPEALAAASLLVLEGRDAATALGRAGRAYVRREHSAERYLAAMAAL